MGEQVPEGFRGSYNGRTLDNEERFVPHVHHFSTATLSACPWLPSSVLRIYDRAEGDYVAHDAPMDADRLKALLEYLKANGRGREY